MSEKVPEGWKRVKLGEVIVFNYGKSLPERKRVSGDIPVYSSAGITGWHNKALANSKGIIIGRKGTIGKVYKSKVPFFAIDTCYYVLPNDDEYDFDFIYYLLFSLKLDELNEDSAVPGLNRNTAYAQEIPLPPLPEQKAIASVLSSLDDKIDLLHRQNKTLEKMAETLFRQWFIEEAKEDWEEKPLSFLGKIVCGKTPSKKKKEYFGGNIPFIKIPDMHGNTFIFETSDSLTEEGKKSQNNKTLPAKSICVSCIATVGLVSMTTKESQTNQQINSIVPKKDYYRYYIFLFMKYLKSLLVAMASGGTTTLNLNTGDFSKITIPLPEENILKIFHNLVEPLFDKILINQQQIRTLEKLRDTLLPKLMSGEVRVKI
ncbi:restriction endonuclease subunit S [Deferribacter abyssi]|uniref:restriction endonuclease subunit S n=1 Tax=Deferribacter abyssi TaxID=213806 RepID=UPI003C23B333